ncbi:hypothetical protein M0802_010735 [Mischocyttarus mexicanus]|nr:hypothetical protein M0802_010735 [Mischocyttarus mexicanus]
MSNNSWKCKCGGGRLDSIIFKKRIKTIACNCGWEGRFIYGVSLTLAIFEMKRFFMLLLEIIAEWQVIRFAGGLRPVLLTLLDIIVGLPTAILAVRIIRNCCSLRSMTPCIHSEMIDKDIKSINENGCAEVISPVLIRIVVIAYVMTSTLIVTQALLAYLITRVMIDRISERIRFPVSSLSSINDKPNSMSKRKNVRCINSSINKLYHRDKIKSEEKGIKIKRLLSPINKYTLTKNTKSTKKYRKNKLYSSMSYNSSPIMEYTMEISDIARIKPTSHEEHRISRKRLLNKRIH